MNTQTTLDQSTPRPQCAQLDLEINFLDKFGPFNLLNMLSEVCFAKAAHLESNWQDTAQSNKWASLANTLSEVADEVQYSFPHDDNRPYRQVN